METLSNSLPDLGDAPSEPFEARGIDQTIEYMRLQPHNPSVPHGCLATAQLPERRQFKPLLDLLFQQSRLDRIGSEVLPQRAVFQEGDVHILPQFPSLSNLGV